MGGGGMLEGKPLEELGGRVMRVMQALDLAAEFLARGEPIPDAATKAMAKPVIPGWLYRLAGGRGWRRQAKAYGMRRSLGRKPYAKTGA